MPCSQILNGWPPIFQWIAAFSPWQFSAEKNATRCARTPSHSYDPRAILKHWMPQTFDLNLRGWLFNINFETFKIPKTFPIFILRYLRQNLEHYASVFRTIWPPLSLSHGHGFQNRDLNPPRNWCSCGSAAAGPDIATLVCEVGKVCKNYTLNLIESLRHSIESLGNLPNDSPYL